MYSKKSFVQQQHQTGVQLNAKVGGAIEAAVATAGERAALQTLQSLSENLQKTASKAALEQADLRRLHQQINNFENTVVSIP